jgi:hypothetical protein
LPSPAIQSMAMAAQATRSVRVARRSTAEIGLAYENHSLAYLTTLRMALRRVGRAGDGGVDLRGTWEVPSGRLSSGAEAYAAAGRGSSSAEGSTWRRLRVVGQCKAERKVLGPRALRELEGVVAHLSGESPRAAHHCGGTANHGDVL